jgi:hypothetical protein
VPAYIVGQLAPAPQVHRFDVISTVSGWTGYRNGVEVFRRSWDTLASAAAYLQAEGVELYSDDVIDLWRKTADGRVFRLSRTEVSNIGLPTLADRKTVCEHEREPHDQTI